ncbi:cell cycle regulator of non-homologous end joining isoform X2 [Oryzias melastigma]|uniref:cell cycle regulator of non-homologous end joining isoform X2 n=1 Tax=Oryzias melastigma TaxID=30732 RepID=UPI000CF808BF|nr:cell cycle regulator of non-homologous end joining isoform X2 [Oryzias melastigma]
MSEKQRTLPLWMANKEMKVKKKTPLKSQRKEKTTRALFYCMNEAELVEAAVQCLTSGSFEDGASPTHQQISKKGNNTREKVNKPSVSLTRLKRMTQISEEKDSDYDPETTCVSETDLDITEVETLPYTRRPEAPRSGTVRNTDVEAEGKEEKPTDEHQEDEALQLVRDIFFT